MAASVQITFLGMTRSPSVEAQIQRWVEKLEKANERITRCAAWIELPHRHGRKGNVFRVRIEIAMPGEPLVVTDQAHHDAHAAIGQAFRAARRQLIDHVRVQRDVKRALLA